MTGTVSEKIERYIGGELTRGGDTVRRDQPLFTGGVIDSLGQVKLLYFVEKEFGVRVRLDEITLENFDTVERIASFIERKREARGQAG